VELSPAPGISLKNLKHTPCQLHNYGAHTLVLLALNDEDKKFGPASIAKQCQSTSLSDTFGHLGILTMTAHVMKLDQDSSFTVRDFPNLAQPTKLMIIRSWQSISNLGSIPYTFYGYKQK
jgi:hypothetical protein